MLGSVKGVHAISGRADGPPTGRSSVGLLARVTDERLARAIEPHLFAARRASAPLAEASSLLLPAFGAEGAAVVTRAIERFVARFPELAADPAAVVHVPCIEGVGDYPITDGALAAAAGVWIAGDAGGRFRGIVASMVSGRYAGLGVTSRAR